MATLGAFFDANVLYPAGLRNFLMYLALTGTFRAHWSAEVHEEWMCNLLENRPDITLDKLERTRRLMEQALPDAMVFGYEHHTETLCLSDRDDRHVLAAAIHSDSSLIVTLNLADFPSDVLAAFDIEAQHPDDFVLALFEAFPGLVLEAAIAHRASLKNPPKNRDEYLDDLRQQGLCKSVDAMREHIRDGLSDL
ncbi:PIN domain-containing protein [Terriglobus aquaticus]|uniref:PIN domain-containing protein n=1 Tax=Terriglobus aquaticus TaxID=940139 RepID=A0ABW9KKF9_9BACT|nr:PIN domain-containing protein [Terriglobus aquaticus]